MAFAGSMIGDKSNPFISEKELMKQVASNITKEALISQKSSAQDAKIASVTDTKLNQKSIPEAKHLMLQNLQKVQKVWYAFVKHIKNQVTINGRLVDTQIIGLFYRDNHDHGNVVYKPSCEYLEAGKFKLSKTSLNSETAANQSMEQYQASYDQLLQTVSKNELCHVSF